jgi:CRP/FNR family transcriptional regulator
LSNAIWLKRDLVLGQRKLRTIFETSSLRLRKAGEILRGDEIYYLRTGWACQFQDLANGRRAIVDVYLPGDLIGLDTVLRTRPLEGVLTVTAVTMGAVLAEDTVMDLTAHRPTALYVAWLLGQRQRRADRLCAAISGLDASGRLAVMVLDFYTRLRRRRLITGATYNLPMSQVQMGHYLGLTVVHINRVLRSMREARIVSLERHCLTILDLERLTSLAQIGGTVSTPGAPIGGPPVDIAFPANYASSITQLGIAGD